MNLNQIFSYLKTNYPNIASGENVMRILDDYDRGNEEFKTQNNKNPQSVEERLKNLRNRYEKNGGSASMNLFPSENGGGACHSFCLTIANKKFDKPQKGLDTGFKGAILAMYAYWFYCLKINQETLILVSNWDEEAFIANYKNIIDQYTQTHNKSVIIIEVSTNDFIPRYG